MSGKFRKGFTLIEMLVVIGIIAVLIAASLGSYSAVTKAAERARARDLVQQVAVALSTMHEKNGGQWPLRLASVGERGDKLNDQAAYAFVSGNTKYLSLSNSGGKLTGYDRFGVLSPWGVQILKQRGSKATSADVDEHLLWFAVDGDGNGIIKCSALGLNVRATAMVWCKGKDGKRIQSWSEGQANE